ncbi:efflux RND transporter permease subunit [Pleomorphovibrio marinus]|uniref:efflux RND transporter permease subunit n=1 Tax=Pleomorphovibrio marinus TaxID=2164132 RepID=UPI000E0CAE40|nr:efflux RND transporter permease subunit [Pleomorphovibrio marinus]
MVRFLLSRPIAVGMTFFALVVFSILLFRTLPISLLPPIDVPQIVVKINYQNASPESIEQNILEPLREGLITLAGLESMESKAGSEVGNIRLTFDYKTKMELAYIEVNEKIDRLISLLPEDLARPQVIRINTNDIPMVRVQILPDEGVDFAEASLLVENVIKKRLEQLEGIALVDINGRQEKVISVSPKPSMLAALGMEEQHVIDAIVAGNSELPGINVEDGQFRYFLRLATRLENPEDVMQLPVRGEEGVTVPLSRVADVSYEISRPSGYHLYNGKQALVVTVHKQAAAKMNELMPKVYESLENFKKDYPQVQFELTQDQSMLLNAGISNLRTSLLFGGIFAFGVLFIFMGNLRTPIIIGISLPSSLIISFLVFYFFGISINVISLSGLALGLGMLIDNSIIVLDNIGRKRKEGLALFEACVVGVEEVMSALISSVLTTLAVFIPLVFLSGISGALFYDQAVSVAAILSVSLLVAFILLPLLYKLFFIESKASILKEDSRLFLVLLGAYKKLYHVLFAKRKLSLLVLFLLIPLMLSISSLLPVEGLPPIEKFDLLLEVDWNEPIHALENKQRFQQLLEAVEGKYLQAESDIGLNQFLLFDGENSIQRGNLYLRFEDSEEKVAQTRHLQEFLRQNYPMASIDLQDAPNAFEQLFSSPFAYYEARWKDLTSKKPVDEPLMDQWLQELPVANWDRGPGLQKESSIIFRLDLDKMATYGVETQSMLNQIEKLFGNYLITDIKRFGEVTPVKLKESAGDFQRLLKETYVSGAENTPYQLSNFVYFNYDNHYKSITADAAGVYQSINLHDPNQPGIEQGLLGWANDKNLAISFTGQYFKDRETIQQLIGILLISVLLLYFILAAQFESFFQPLIVIFTLPLGIGGAFFVLWVTGTSLNVMSAIGLVVMLGIMVNDAILKIDTINRLRNKLGQQLGMAPGEALEKAMYQAGEIRLKPIVMTSITTILALLPVVFSAGLGADLQRPLVLSVIGGLTIGTFTALYFVPLSYWLITKKY